MVEVSLTVGKLDASLALLLTKDHHLIEFPTILLPNGVKAGSIVKIKCEQDYETEKIEEENFQKVQDEILTTFGKSLPKDPVLKIKNITQTSCVLEWDSLDLGTSNLKSLILYKDGKKLGSIPQPLNNKTTKLSGLPIDKSFTFQIKLDTTAGIYSSNVLEVTTHKMTDLSGITVCLGDLSSNDPFDKHDIELALKSINAKPLQSKIQVDTTHFVSTRENKSNPEFLKAQDMNIPIIRPEWLKACERERRIVGVTAFYLKECVLPDIIAKNYWEKKNVNETSKTDTAETPSIESEKDTAEASEIEPKKDIVETSGIESEKTTDEIVSEDVHLDKDTEVVKPTEDPTPAIITQSIQSTPTQSESQSDVQEAHIEKATGVEEERKTEVADQGHSKQSESTQEETTKEIELNAGTDSSKLTEKSTNDKNETVDAVNVSETPLGATPVVRQDTDESIKLDLPQDPSETKLGELNEGDNNDNSNLAEPESVVEDIHVGVGEVASSDIALENSNFDEINLDIAKDDSKFDEVALEADKEADIPVNGGSIEKEEDPIIQEVDVSTVTIQQNAEVSSQSALVEPIDDEEDEKVEEEGEEQKEPEQEEAGEEDGTEQEGTEQEVVDKEKPKKPKANGKKKSNKKKK